MSRASDSELGVLHGVVAKFLTQKLESGEATASDVANAIKLLKDNNITAAVEPGSALAELESQLGCKPSPVSGEDLAQALAEMEWSKGIN